MGDAEDPYVIYQLRKPHQRGTAVVPRLVPKSHAPAFSHVSNRFARVRPAPDDEQLYLPKSLEYPTNWGSFGSESSIWSASSAASAFPNRVQPLAASSNGTSLVQPSRLRTIGSAAGSAADSVDDDDASSARSVTSLTERTSLLSSDGTRSLKSFIRFDAPLTSGLQAPVAVRPAQFLLPPPLSQVEREDSIVQAAIDDPTTVAPTDDEIIIESASKNSMDSHPVADVEATHASRSRHRLSLRPRQPYHSVSTRQRRSMFAWLFGGGEKPLGGRRYGDAYAAPIMDEDEEAQRRAQFVRSGKEDTGRQSRSFVRRFSWRKRSTSVDSRRNNGVERDGQPLGGGRRSARQIWRSIRRSASFTLGSKKNNDFAYRQPEEPRVDDLTRPRVDISAEDMSGPSDSFVKRKMASLRDSTSRRMAVAAGEIDVVNDSILRIGRRHETPIIPTERREDRPRASKSTPSASSRPSQSGSRMSATMRAYNSSTNTVSLSELISARPELQHATSESVELLANRINSDLSHGTTLPSVSEQSGSSARSTPVRDGSFGLLGSGLEKGALLQTSAVSSEGNSEGLLPAVQNIVCEKAHSPIMRPMKSSFQHPRSTRASTHARSNVATELRLSSASKMSIEMLKARTAAVSGSPNTPKSSLKSVFYDIGAEKARRGNSSRSDYSHPHATQLDVFCQCSCSCVYESDCQQSCDVNNSSDKAALYPSAGSDTDAKVRSKPQKQREIFDDSKGAESPSLSLINGSRTETPHKISAEEWMETIRRRLENFPTPGSTGAAVPSGASYRAVDELGNVTRKAGYAQSGRFEEVGNTDWAARYGKPSRPMPSATIAHEPDARGLSYHPRERHASSSSSAARELSPQRAPSVEYRGGIRVERRRGDPLRSRRAPNQGSTGNNTLKSSTRAEPGTPQMRVSLPRVSEPPVTVPHNAKAPVIIKYPVANGRSPEPIFRVLSPPQNVVPSHESSSKARQVVPPGYPSTSSDSRGSQVKSKPRKPRVRSSAPAMGAEAPVAMNALSPSEQWLAEHRSSRPGRPVPPSERTSSRTDDPGRVRLVEEHARSSSRTAAPRVEGRTRAPDDHLRRHANMQPRHGRSALREVHRDEVRAARPRAPVVKPEEAGDLRRSGGRSIMGRILGM